ncbi:hypothetical protein SARC_16838 [Sphaeroforma arctica JP610]|uniref:Pentacotripeptide-repeat region of PRORP domain-containing protein n=1 Tax=Sphaeroforma arctica JP610 TaxID=667725 RepID=A0A0L0F1R2_9EUKA|nr:hypothetical protein SARC_16838 [Sphaeroforma arctica JP610]KNC70632.1 hypothetical protein SARC_16838 [Sphaeroforma arctica JP610]|eukprot:XP_014144534.1 hypothetical protein SARC_16838 [Sphaeroforma arctica JP610]
MDIKGIKRDTITYSAVISACGKGVKWQYALDLFDEMEIKGITRNTITYNAAITACGRGNQCKKALEIFMEMSEKNIPKAHGSYIAIIQALGSDCTNNDVIDALYEDMLTSLPDFGQRWLRLNRHGMLDLHDHSQYMAQAATRRLLRILQKQEGYDSPEKSSELKCIIVGQGNDSADGLQLLKAVQAQLESLSPPIASYTQSENSGQLALNKRDLGDWLKHKA